MRDNPDLRSCVLYALAGADEGKGSCIQKDPGLVCVFPSLPVTPPPSPFFAFSNLTLRDVSSTRLGRPFVPSPVRPLTHPLFSPPCLATSTTDYILVSL